MSKWSLILRANHKPLVSSPSFYIWYNLFVKKALAAVLIILLFLLGIYLLLLKSGKKPISFVQVTPSQTSTANLNPLSIEAMRAISYPGSEIKIEKTLPDGNNYHQYIASYISDGLKIFALLTIPIGDPSAGSGQAKPKNGWPVILFNHGYISPETYQTYPSVGQYATYVPVFAEKGYIVFKPDYRGNGNSDGKPEGAYYSPAYATDDLNALSSIKKYKDPSTGSGQVADPEKIGIWGHSMGGNITLRDLVVNTKDIKAAVIWGGVVGSYDDLMNNWQRRVRYVPSAREFALRNASRANLISQNGTPQENPTFWNSIDPTYFVKDIASPVQIHTGGSDEEVPAAFSQSLYDKLKSAGKTTEFYSYPGADHNISQGFSLAMERSVAFFDKYLK